MLDEILVRQRVRPVPSGIILGLLVVAQFFTSTEVLASTSIMVVIGVTVLLLGGRGSVIRGLRHATGSLLVAGGTAGVLLAVPVYVLLFGPHHINGPAQEGLAAYSANLGGPIVPQANMVFHTAPP